MTISGQPSKSDWEWVKKQIAEDAQTGDRDVADRFGQLTGAVVEVVQQLLHLAVEIDLVPAQRVEPALKGIEEIV